MDEINTKLLSLDNTGVHITSPKIMEKLTKKNLSPSMISGLEDCHARWVADTFVMRDLVEEEPDNAARRGSLFHKVMEDFFALEPEDRTTNAIKKIVKENLETGEYADLGQIPEAVQWLRTAVNNYYNMGGKPKEVKIATFLMDGEEKSGIELFVKGYIGNTKRPILGFIDQVIEDPTKEDSVLIQDWKSGGKVKKWSSKTKGTDGLSEQRQQIIYSELLRQKGVKVSGARLIFPVAREVVDVELGNEELRNDVIAAVEEADRKLDDLIESNTFEYKPGFLCAWCPLSKICPKAMIKPYAKMQEAYAKQPAPEVLMQGIEIL